MTTTEPNLAAGDAAKRFPSDPTAAVLTAERDFLLRSLADLEAEHAAGELSQERFRELHDRYTVQAAAVLRALDRIGAQQSLEGVPGESPRGRRVRGIVAATAVAVFIVGLGGALLVRAVGERQPGQTITGNAQSIVPAARIDALARTARDRPTDPAAHMAYASALLEAGKMVDALRAFDTAARLDPGNPAPKAYGGWIVFLAGLTDEAIARLDAAVATDPAYPDARFFRGMALLRGRGDRGGALVEFREYLRLAPDAPERDQVQVVIDEIEVEPAPAR